MCERCRSGTIEEYTNKTIRTNVVPLATVSVGKHHIGVILQVLSRCESF